MNTDKRPSIVPIRARLSGIEVIGNIEKNYLNARPNHFVVVSVDDKEVAKSETKPMFPSPRWEWQEDYQFWFQPSSTIKIMIYRKSRTRVAGIKHLVGQYIGKLIDLLESDATFDFQIKDKTSIGIATQIKIDLSVASESDSEENFKSLMKIIDADIVRLDNTGLSAGISSLGAALQLTKKVMDIVANAHPVLKASWSVMSSVYEAVQQIELLDDTVRELTESLREVLGVVKEYPDLLLIKGTTNVIEEIGRISLKTTSLIHEYTTLPFARRTLNSQLSDDMKSRIEQCQKSCDDLKQKFDRRVNIDTNRQGARTEGVITEFKATINKNNENIRSTLKTIKDDQLAKDIYKWLSAPDSSKNYNEAREKHQRDTCSWFLNGTRFRELQEQGGLLWIKGTAGCGKTILCSSIIEKIIEIYKENASIAYFFFDGRDSQKDSQLHGKLIRSLISQLSLQCDGIPGALVKLYGNGQQQPSTSALQDTLYRLIEELCSTYIIIDSLDECTERERVLQWIEQIISHKRVKLYMVVLSRPERDISDVLQPLDPRCVDLAAEVNQDVAIYLNQQLALVKKWDEGMRETIKSTLIKHAQGMFRWVALQLTELKKCSNEDSVKEQLDSLPEGLYETYDRILLKINKQNRTDTQTFLRWLSFSTRPMTLEEIAEAIVVDLSDTVNGPRYAPSRRYWDKRDVLEKCSGLISESGGTIKLAHFSIKEYLISEYLRINDSTALTSFHLLEELSHSFISQTCLTYLLQFDKADSLDQNVIKSFPLALYAAEHWIFHAQSGNMDKSPPSFTLALAQDLFTPSHTFSSWIEIWNMDAHHSNVGGTIKIKTIVTMPLYYASLAGLQQLSQHLVENGVDVNVKGGSYSNALQAALANRQNAIAELLITKGADVNAQGGFYGNALQAASVQGQEAIVKLLVEKGADVNARGGYYGNALQAALSNGQEAIVKLLLEKGANVNAYGRVFGNALQAASIHGQEAIVKLLLEKEANVNAQGGEYGSALQAASTNGQEAIVKLLLEKGADVNAQGGYHGNALQAASARGREAIVKLLLEKGADVNGQGGRDGNALQAASADGLDTIVRLLLEKGADVNAQGGKYGTALQAASANGHEATVKLLLAKGADVNAQGEECGTALQAASVYGRDAIAKLLLEKGADVNAQGGLYGTSLQAASAFGQETTARLLLEKGADVNAQGGKYGTALQAASARGEESIVKLLLGKGPDVNAQGGKYGTALQAASAKGQEAVVQILLEKGADVNAQGGYYGDALQGASAKGREAIVRLLLEKGADTSELSSKSLLND